MPELGDWRSWARTDIGCSRKANQDSFIVRPEIGVWMVADGAGGHEHGEMASQMLAERMAAMAPHTGPDLVTEIRTIVSQTHQSLRQTALEEAERTGGPVLIASTVAVFLASGAHYACLWAGDSRIYRLRAGALSQLTRDHSLVQVLVDQGAISAEEAEHHPQANVVTRAVGADGPEPDLDKVTDRAEPGDRFLICSDGLNKALDDRTIGGHLAAPDPANRLIEAALAARVRDNVTAIALEYAPPGEDDTLLRRP